GRSSRTVECVAVYRSATIRLRGHVARGRAVSRRRGGEGVVGWRLPCAGPIARGFGGCRAFSGRQDRADRRQGEGRPAVADLGGPAGGRCTATVDLRRGRLHPAVLCRGAKI